MKGVVYEEYAPDDNYAKILKVKEVPNFINHTFVKKS
jgi:alcohol dehydrogenase